MQRLSRIGFASSSSSAVLSFVLAAGSAGCGSTGTNDDGSPGNDGGVSADGGDGHHADGGSTDTDPPTGLPDGVVAVPLLACVPLVYAADMGIGGQTFRVIVDTGSTSLGVAGAGCSNCSVAPLYTPGSTAVDQKKNATAQFGTGSWSGKIYEDVVGPTEATSVPVKLVSITSQTGFFQPGSSCGGKAYQGLLGLSQPASAVQGTNGFFDQYVAKKGVPDVFATQLCDTDGTLWLGGFDSAATTAPPQYVPFTNDVASTAYYAVNLQTITVGGTVVPIAAGQYNDSLVDTGSSVFLLGSTAYDKLAAAISATDGFKKVLGASGNWFASAAGQPKCAALKQSKADIDATLPPLTLTFAGGVTAQAVATESYLMPYPGAGYCNALISQPQSPSFPIASLMGAPILRSNVVIFDRAQKRLGLAPHKACPAARAQGMSEAVPTALGVKPRIGYPLSR
jgi:hypothetical protein